MLCPPGQVQVGLAQELGMQESLEGDLSEWGAVVYRWKSLCLLVSSWILRDAYSLTLKMVAQNLGERKT